MNIELYPKNAYYMMVSSAITQLGSYQIASDGDLALAHVRVYHRNPDPYSYQIRLVCSSRVGGPVLVASNWETFSSETTGQTSEFWLGDITFTFADYPLKAMESYYFRLETSGYIRQDNDAYLGVWLDWMQPVGTSDTAGGRIALGVKR